MAAISGLQESLFDRVEALAEKHPKSYIVVDVVTHRVLGMGVNPSKLLTKIAATLKADEIPFIYKKPKEGQKLLL